MNIEFTRKVIKALKKEGTIRSGFDMYYPISECCTAGCIAGTACLVSEESFLHNNIMGIAQEKFGINNEVANSLFYPMEICDWDTITPDKAIEVLELLIEDPTRVQWNKVLGYEDE